MSTVLKPIIYIMAIIFVQMVKGEFMIKAIIISLILLPVFAATGVPVEADQPLKAPDTNFEIERAQVLKKLDMTMNSLQEDKACIQAAKNHAEFRLCFKKLRAEMQERLDETRERRRLGNQIPPQEQ